MTWRALGNEDTDRDHYDGCDDDTSTRPAGPDAGPPPDLRIGHDVRV
jgi:hypothetical protein